MSKGGSGDITAYVHNKIEIYVSLLKHLKIVLCGLQ